MSQCEICMEIYGYNTPCDICSLGNPCIGCSDYVNGECITNGGCGEEKEEEKMSEIRIFDADDEEPNCNRCDHMECSDEFCANCGATFWSGYRRTEIIKE